MDLELKKIFLEQSSEMESSIRGGEHLEGGLGESSQVGQVQRTQQAIMASTQWSRQGAREMRSEILIRNLVV